MLLDKKLRDSVRSIPTFLLGDLDFVGLRGSHDSLLTFSGVLVKFEKKRHYIPVRINKRTGDQGLTLEQIGLVTKIMIYTRYKKLNGLERVRQLEILYFLSFLREESRNTNQSNVTFKKLSDNSKFLYELAQCEGYTIPFNLIEIGGRPGVSVDQLLRIMGRMLEEWSLKMPYLRCIEKAKKSVYQALAVESM